MTDWNTMNVWGSEVLASADLNSNFENVSFLLTQVLMTTCNGRLTLETGVPISTSDQTGKTTLYFTPFSGRGNLIGLYDGVDSMWSLYSFNEVSLSLAGYTADKNYDIWGYLSGGALALASTVWTNDTTRATALTLSSGIYVKSGATTHRYLGTIRINASGGQCEDTNAQRYVWNMHNRVERLMYCQDTTDSWNYTTATWREANSNTSYGVGRVGAVVGLKEELITVNHNGLAKSTGNVEVATGVGINSTSSNSAQTIGTGIGSDRDAVKSTYKGILDIGFSYIQRLEISQATGTTTWYGDNNLTYFQSGMFATMRM